MKKDLKSTSYSIGIILLIAFVYYFTGRLGQLVALPPGYVTPVWPPSGIALAAVLLFGYRVWPGIFLGSFLNNFLLFPVSSHLLFYFESTVAGMGIGIGATLQACLGAYLMQKWIPSGEWYEKSEYAFKFFIISMLSSLVNSNVGLLFLCSLGQVSWDHYFYNWWTWWLGDTSGIFIITPMILCWVKWPSWPKQRILEGMALLVLIAALFSIILTSAYPLIYMIIPFLVWAGFRFKQQGITLLIFLITIVICWGTANRLGPFFFGTLNESLLLVQSFVAVVTMMSLLLVGALSERDRAQRLLADYNISLERKVVERTSELEKRMQQVQHMQKQIVNQEKLASLGTLTAGIAHEIKNPLNFIINFADVSMKTMQKLAPAQVTEEMQENAELLSQNLAKMLEYGKKANNIVENMLMHARGKPGGMQATDINRLIDEYVGLAYHGCQDPVFYPKIEKEYDSSLDKIRIVPQDFCRAFINIVNNAIYSLRLKKKRMGDSFQPLLRITTLHKTDRAMITVYDNGIGIPQDALSQLFIPFFTTKPAGEGTGLGLSIAHDIIVIGHGGEISINTEEGQYAEFTIILPITR